MRNSLRICDDADDVFFDSRRHRLYVSCGEGAVDVIQESGTGYARLGRIKTKPGARTSLFVPQMDRLIVAARAGFFWTALGRDLDGFPAGQLIDREMRFVRPGERVVGDSKTGVDLTEASLRARRAVSEFLRSGESSPGPHPVPSRMWWK